MTSLAILLAAANPVVSMFPQNVTFHAGFDDGTVEAAIGMTPDHSRSWKNYSLCDGLFGKALSRGMVGYRQRPEQPLVDGERPGSVVLWVRLNAEQQPRTRGLAKWEGGGAYFEAAGDGGARLIVMKSVDYHWGDGEVLLYVCRKNEFGKLLTRCVGARLTYTDWKVGSWRMVAAAWTTDKLFISVDGKPFAERPYDFSLGKLAGSVYVKSDYWNEKRDRGNDALSTFSVDEVTVFDRKLTDAEVAAVYEKTKAAASLRGASTNRAASTNRRKSALPSDAVRDPDFGCPGGMALWQSTESPAFAFAYAHRGEPASPQPCRTAESPLARTSARPGGQSATGAERRCRTRAISRVRRDFDPPCAQASAMRERQNTVGGAREMSVRAAPPRSALRANYALARFCPSLRQ